MMFAHAVEAQAHSADRLRSLAIATITALLASATGPIMHCVSDAYNCMVLLVHNQHRTCTTSSGSVWHRSDAWTQTTGLRSVVTIMKNLKAITSQAWLARLGAWRTMSKQCWHPQKVGGIRMSDVTEPDCSGSLLCVSTKLGVATW